MKNLVLLLVLTLAAFCFGVEEKQPSLWKHILPFGKLVPHSTFKSKIPNITDEQKIKEIYSTFQKMRPIKDNFANIKSSIAKDLQMTRDENDSPLQNHLECLAAMNRWLQDVETQLYAVKMWDAWGTPQTGVLEGNVRWLGHYDECLTAGNDEFNGKWCASYYGIIYYPYPMGYPFGLSLGMCFPSTCSDASISYLYRKNYQYEDFPPLLVVRCPHVMRYSTLDIICTVVISIMVLLCSAGTFYDLFMKRNAISPINSSQQTSLQGELLLSFSIICNTEKIIDMKKRPGTIPVLDGIRVITTTWVVIGHILQTMFYGIDNSLYARRVVTEDAGYMVIINAFYAVDTFFFLSGLLVMYLGMKHIHKTLGSVNIPLMYLQRYLRLTPLYAFCILFHMSLYKYLGSGPFWGDITSHQYDSCKNNWWTNLVYINNLYPLSNECYAVAWYLANDMQFYILSPVFLLLFYHWPIAGLVASLNVVVGTTLYTGLITFFYDLQPTVISLVQQLNYTFRLWVWNLVFGDYDEYTYEDKLLTDTYYMPWARIHVYIIGMLTGYFLFVTKGKVKMHWAVVLIGWIVAAGSALGIIYGPSVYVQNMEDMPNDLSALYCALSRPVFAACLTWVVVACCSGYGGPVTKLLDWKVFKPLSRLTYSTYLAHIYVMTAYAYTQEDVMHFLTVNMVFFYLGTVILSFAVGFLLSIFIEWPISGALKILLDPKSWTKRRSVPESVSSQESTDASSTSNSNNTNELPVYDNLDLKKNSEYENISYKADTSF